MNHLKLSEEGIARLVWMCATYETRRIVQLAKRKYGEDNVATNITDAEYKQQFIKFLTEKNQEVGRYFRTFCLQGFACKAKFHEMYGNENLPTESPIKVFEYVINDVRDKKVDASIIFLMAKDFNSLIYGMYRNYYNPVIPSVEKDLPLDTDYYYNEQFVYIHYPEITVTSNENEKLSVHLQDYFLRFNTTNGMIASQEMTHQHFQIGLFGTKATYTKAQLMSNYVHSHRPRLEGHTDSSISKFLLFKAQCVGEDSPIVDYVHSVENSFKIGNQDGWHMIPDSYIRMWFSHIDNYISVESSLGGPYMYMTEINNSVGGEDYLRNARYSGDDREYSSLNSSCFITTGVSIKDIFDENQIRGFVKFYSNGKIINFANTESDLVLHFTNLYNLCAKRLGVVPKACTTRVNFDSTMNKLVMSAGSSVNAAFIARVEACQRHLNFNGKEYKITLSDNQDNNSILVLNPNVYATIKLGILQIVNQNNTK